MSVTPLKIEKLSVTFQGTEVLSLVDCQIAGGDYIGIVGPNGSGKTTLVRAALGLVPVASGKIILFGQPMSEFSDWQKIGYLPQRISQLDPRFPASVEEIVASGLITSRPYPKRMKPGDREKVCAILDELGIQDLKDRMIGRLSGGQQQRVLLARAMVHEPELLFLDEPTTALDPATRESFYELLGKINKARRTTILFVSHDPATMGKYASKLLYLDKKVIFFGTFDEFCHSTDMQAYFGTGQHLICHRHG
ncbi:MAG: metal ABC transporter ATP-binding protein [Candidatus Omnitrophica bacterium]|nr:metal ABC transporter ATP-binding protein [Candidatus Omnitrophota bacterium]